MRKKLRRKFIVLATFSVFVILLTVIGLSNIIINLDTDKEMDTIASLIIKNEGRMPLNNSLNENKEELTVEIRYGIRYFSAYTDLNGNVKTINNEHVATVNNTEISNFAQRLVRYGVEKGKIKIDENRYYYRIKKMNNEYLIVFVDGTSRYAFAKGVGVYTTIVALASVFFFSLVIIFLSSIVIKPFEENVENQRQFITNAGHELKTPLAVISANAEVLEMTQGKNEWTGSILNQVKRLSGLVNDLIMMSKISEGKNIEMARFDYSKEAGIVCESFKSIAVNEKKKYNYEIEDGLELNGNQKMLSELINIFLDNAFKYCDPDGSVELMLKSRTRHKGIRLTVSNTYKEGEKVDYTKFFQRFYRQDESHNSKKAGYGIGLSMAETIVKGHKGRISVGYKNGMITFEVLLNK